MKKYILKKDLPFAKAGKEISFLEDELTVIITEGDMNYTGYEKLTYYYIGEVKDLDRLIKEGWIDVIEVKNNRKLKLVFKDNSNIAEVLDCKDGKLYKFDIFSNSFYKSIEIELPE